MSCQEFSTYAAELARGRLIEAATRDAAHAHADACAPCAARLARERSLSAALRATAEAMAGESAPERVGALVLAAFRESRDGGRAPARVQPAGRVASARVSAARKPGRTLRALAASAVAASLLLAFTLARRAQLNPDDEQARPAPLAGYQPTGGQLSAASRQAATRGGERASRTVVGSAEEGSTEEGSKAFGEGSNEAGSKGIERGTNGVEAGRRGLRRDESAAAGRSRKRALPEFAASFELDGGQAIVGDESEAVVSTPAASLPETERLTEFVSVAAGADSAPLDGGQLVRVKVPRAALASLGLPVDAELAGESVKADILFAHDGTARAIRLVR